MLSILARLVHINPRRQAAILLSSAFFCVLVGALAFSLTQRVSYGTALYWAITTATTVGYGDVTPHNGIGRVVAIAVMLTTIPLVAALFAMLAGATAISHLRRLLGVERRSPTGRFRLLLGNHPSLPSICEELLRADLGVVVVADVEPDLLPQRVHLIRGDPTQEHLLKRALPDRAEQALLMGGDDFSVLITAVLLHQLAPSVPAVALVRSGAVRDALAAVGVSRCICEEELMAHAMAKTMESPHAADLLLRLVDGEDYRLIERSVGTELVGQRFSELRRRPGPVVLGLVQAGKVVLGVGHDPVVQDGDALLMLESLVETVSP